MAKGWAAAHLRLRSEVRTTRAGLALLVAVIALSSGVTMAAAAGARRSDSAYGRFRVWAHDPDITVSGCDCPDQVDEVFARLRAAPFVLDSVRTSFAEISPELPDGTRASFLAFLPVVDIEGRLGRDLPRVKVLHGRLPNPAAADEVAVGILTAERFHLAVGDELRLQARDAQNHLYVVETARIAGIYAAPGELPSASGAQSNSFLMTAAFARAFPDLVHAGQDSLLLRLRPGTKRAEAQAFIDSIAPLELNDPADLTSGIERTVRIETIALVVLGLVVAGVGLVVVGQMLRRQSVAERDERVTYSALGCDRGDALRLGLLRGVAVGATGTALGVIVAVAMSPLFPVGVGRIADPDVGVHADVVVLGVGVAVALTSVALLGVLTAASSVWSGRREHEPRIPWPLPSSRPPVLAGFYFALPRRAGRRGSSPARVSLVSLVVVVAVLAGTAVTLASFDHLVGRRDLAGATWQVAVETQGDNGPVDLAGPMAAVRAVPGVDAVTAAAWATVNNPGPAGSGLYVDGHLLATQIFGDEGPIRPAITRGRPPFVQGEVALGSKTLAALGVGIGDEVSLALDPGGPSLQGRVVGDVVLASPFFYDFAPGTGAATVASTFTALGAGENDTARVLLVRYKDGVDQRRMFGAVEDALGTDAAFESADRQAVSGLGRIRLVPILLLIGMLALVVAAVSHVLLVSVAGHRRDMAVLRAIGFTKRQSWTSVAIHASLLGLVACFIGIPLGVVIGRAAWERIAASLFVVPRPMAPLELLALIGLVLVAVAIVASLMPAARAVRPKPAVVLRTD